MKILTNSERRKKVGLSLRLRLDVMLDTFDTIAPTFINYPTGPTDTSTNRRVLNIEDSLTDPESGLDMDFEIIQTPGQPNIAKITIWNMSAKTFNLIKEKSNICDFYCAFGRDDYSLMFRGSPESSWQKALDTNITDSQGFLRQSYDADKAGNNDIATVLMLYDGLEARKEAKVNKTYKGNVSAEVIIRDCVDAMGLIVGQMKPTAAGYPMMKDYVARGFAKNKLDEIAGKMFCQWNDKNGIFNLYSNWEYKGNGIYELLENRKVTVPEFGIELNGDNSNRPELVKENDFEAYKIQTMLIPSIGLNDTIRCNFSTLTGDRTVVKVVHKGNNYGTEGVSEVYVQ